MKRIQGKKYLRLRDKLVSIAYSVTTNGNICLYYDGNYYHYLNDQETEMFDPAGLIKR